MRAIIMDLTETPSSCILGKLLNFGFLESHVMLYGLQESWISIITHKIVRDDWTDVQYFARQKSRGTYESAKLVSRHDPLHIHRLADNCARTYPGRRTDNIIFRNFGKLNHEQVIVPVP
mgnify:CR=1 FL=1|jgi:hypothetical protein